VPDSYSAVAGKYEYLVIIIHKHQTLMHVSDTVTNNLAPAFPHHKNHHCTQLGGIIPQSNPTDP
jgi:hypothetical protein